MITIKLFYRSYQINYFLPFSWQNAPSKITPQWDRKDEAKKKILITTWLRNLNPNLKLSIEQIFPRRAPLLCARSSAGVESRVRSAFLQHFATFFSLSFRSLRPLLWVATFPPTQASWPELALFLCLTKGGLERNGTLCRFYGLPWGLVMAARVEKLRNRSWANLPLQELSAKHQLSDKLKLIFYKKKRGEAKSFSRAFFYLFRNIFLPPSRLDVPPFSEARFQHIFFVLLLGFCQGDVRIRKTWGKSWEKWQYWSWVFGLWEEADLPGGKKKVRYRREESRCLPAKEKKNKNN